MRSLTNFCILFAVFAFPAVSHGEWAFSIVPANLTVFDTTGMGSVSIFATNDFNTVETLTLNAGDNIEFSSPGTGTNVLGPNGINGVVSTNNGLSISPGETVELATLTFTDTVGGTPSNPLVDQFVFGFLFQSESAPEFSNVFAGSINVTAIPEPATIASVALVFGVCIGRRRRK